MQVRPSVPSGSAENQCGACHPSSFSSPGFPVMCCEDVFLSDPLLPRGQRAPLYVSQARQQVSTLPALASPQPSRRAWEEPLASPLSSGDGLSEAAAPTPSHVPQGPPHSILWLLHRLAQWA